jgi:molybdopterin/thiamine biosynthesis adenylyltransferase
VRDPSVARYARQVAVAGVGAPGQARIAAARVEVDGDGFDAEVAALYLAGAGVGRLRVAARVAVACRALNTAIEVEEGAAPGALVVHLHRRPGLESHRPAGDDPVDRGARAARWVLARLLGDRT